MCLWVLQACTCVELETIHFSRVQYNFNAKKVTIDTQIGV